MANEHTLIVETMLPINFTVSDSNGIEKGTLMTLSDPMTVAAHAGGSAATICGGVLAQEKIASNGQTKAPVYRSGIFKGIASGTITVGDALTTDTFANHLKSAKALTAFDLSGGRIWGIALETAATAETFFWELRPESGGSGVN